MIQTAKEIASGRSPEEMAGGCIVLIVIAAAIAAFNYLGWAVVFGLISLAVFIGAIVIAVKRRVRQQRLETPPPSIERQDSTPPFHKASMEDLTQDETYYASLLGIAWPASVSDIQRAYRNMAAQYHPDKVQHLGAEIRQLAEAKSREINAAYEFFRQRHHF